MILLRTEQNLKRLGLNFSERESYDARARIPTAMEPHYERTPVPTSVANTKIFLASRTYHMGRLLIVFNCRLTTVTTSAECNDTTISRNTNIKDGFALNWNNEIKNYLKSLYLFSYLSYNDFLTCESEGYYPFFPHCTIE